MQLVAAPRRWDADCSLRAALLGGLRSCAEAADGDLLERAARTCEYSYSGEAAANLRAAALLALSEVDERTAVFHAVRLLPGGVDRLDRLLERLQVRLVRWMLKGRGSILAAGRRACWKVAVYADVRGAAKARREERSGRDGRLRRPSCLLKAE